MDEREKQRQAGHAAAQFAQRTLVYLSPDPVGKLARTCASGTMFLARNGRAAILTAAHAFDDVEPPFAFQVGYEDFAEPLADAFTAVSRGPDGVDVALAWVRDDAADLMRQLACPIACVPDSAALDDDVGVLLCGHPYDMVVMAVPRSGGNVRYQLFPSIAYFTSYKGRTESGRLRINWSEAIVEKEAAEKFRHLAVEPGVPFKLPRPNGISGGAAWHFPPLAKTDIWSPEKAARLVGVPHAWNTIDSQFAEPAELWASWLRSELGF